jgi:AraC family transcriptional regulator
MLPAPLESSRARGWNGIVVERYRANDVDVVARSSAVLVTVHLGPAVTMVQTRYKKTDRRRITKGDITVTPPGKSKGWQHRGQADFVALWLAPALIRNAATVAGEIRPERVEILDNFGTRDAQIEQLGLSLLAELECEGFGGRLYVESLASALAVHLLRRYSTAGAAVRPTATVLPSFKLRRATEYINDNLSRGVSLSEIACAVAMSPYHFTRVFKQTTGIAPHQYLIERRVECAKSLLRETDLSITEIAHRIGCTNQSHFSMLFHRATAMTPSIFRQQR